MNLFDYLVSGLIIYFNVGLAIFVITWFCFVFLMWGRKHWGRWFVYPLAPLLLVAGVVGWLLDVFFNIFYATLIFLDWPDIHKGMRVHDITLSHRLRQILRHDTKIKEDSIRWSIADFICEYFIEPSDCTHCGRNKAK